MLKSEVLAYFDDKGTKAARLLNIEPSAVYQWGEVIPELQAIKLEKLTKGKLKYRPHLYSRQPAA